MITEMHTEEEYYSAVRRFSEMLDREAELSEAELIQMSILGDALISYEREHHPIPDKDISPESRDQYERDKQTVPAHPTLLRKGR